MTRRWLLLVLSAVVFALVGLGATASATTSTTARIARVPDAGVVLVDGATGRTLYTLTDATGAAVPCTGACLTAWPALSVGAGAQATAPQGATGLRSTADGGVTYRGRPLYLFSGDPAAGTANGNGVTSFGGTWRVVKITGKAAKRAKPATAIGGVAGGATTATTNPVQGYGY